MRTGERNKSVRKVIASAGIAFVAASFISLGEASVSAEAAQGSTEEADTLPFGWYNSSPAYVPGASPSILTDEALSSQGISVLMFSSDGGPPAHGQGDIAVSQSLTTGVDSKESVSIDFRGLPIVQEEIQNAAFTDARAIPKESTYNQTGCSQSLIPAIDLAGSTFTFTRPELRKGCATYDSGEYEFQAALLADNGRKYLADFTLNFGLPSADATPDTEPTADPVEEAPVETAEPKDQEAEPPVAEETTKPEPAEKEAAPKETSNKEDGDPLLSLVIGGGIVLVLIATAAVVLRRKQRRLKADANGNLVGGAPKRFHAKTNNKEDTDE